MRRIVRLVCLLLCLLMCGAALAESPVQEAEAAPIMQLHQMKIGCADGYLVRVGDINMLIDGGNATPKTPTDAVVNYLRAAGVDKIDVYIITHWHLDHCMNMNAVLAEFGDAETIIYSPADRVPDEIFNGSVTVEIGAPVNGTHRQMKAGDVLELGGMTITCIGPEKLSRNGGCNADSLNFVLQYGDRRILFTGDFVQSNGINGEYRDLCADVDVLKFPHHGLEPYEIGTKAMRVVRPKYVLVPGSVKRFSIWNFADDIYVKFPVENVYTNADGPVVILTDGGEYFEVRTQQEPADYAKE